MGTRRHAALALGALLAAWRAGAAPDAAPGPKPARPGAAAPPAEKASVAVVVGTPTVIVPDRASAVDVAPPAAALHSAPAPGRPIAAATVVAFPSPSSALSELDRETVDGIARVARREGGELLVWARAPDSSLMAEAQRRAEEIRARAAGAGLDPGRVVTRITTRTGAPGVDVVVSALREGKASASSPAASAAQAAPALLPGESGKRQLRDALVAVRPSIAACLGEHMQRLRLERAEATASISVSPAGKATGVLTGGGDLAGSDLDECLGRAAAAWTLPASDAGYVADVPLTAIRAGPAR